MAVALWLPGLGMACPALGSAMEPALAEAAMPCASHGPQAMADTDADADVSALHPACAHCAVCHTTQALGFWSPAEPTHTGPDAHPLQQDPAAIAPFLTPGLERPPRG